MNTACLQHLTTERTEEATNPLHECTHELDCISVQIQSAEAIEDGRDVHLA